MKILKSFKTIIKPVYADSFVTDPIWLKTNVVYILRLGSIIYIGKTTYPVQERIKCHINLLSRGVHSNSDLQKNFAINPLSLEAQILETSIQEDHLLFREKHWLDYFNSKNLLVISHNRKYDKEGRRI